MTIKKVCLRTGFIFPMAFVVCAGLLSAAEPATPDRQPAAATAQTKAESKAPRPIPFHGTLAAFSPVAQTVTVGQRTFVVTSETKLYKSDKKEVGTWRDAVVGGRVTGSYVKGADGKLIAKSVYFKTSGAPVGPGQAPATPAKPPSQTAK